MSVYSINSMRVSEATVAPGHILDTLIESATKEMNMFNAVLGLDFFEVYTEADESLDDDKKEEKKAAATDAGKTSIFKKIGEMIAEAAKKIKDFFDTYIAKLQNFFSNDSKLVEKYEKKFQDGVKAKKPLKKFTVLKTFSENTFEANITKIKNDSKDVQNEIVKASEISEKTNIAKEFSAKPDVNVEEIHAGLFGDEKTDYPLTEDDAKIVLAIMKNSKTFISTVKASKDKAISALEEQERANKNKANQGKEKGDDSQVADANAIYNVISKTVVMISKLASAYCGELGRYIRDARKAFVGVAGGKDPEKEAEKVEKANPDATAEEKEEAKNEAVMFNYALTESSDYYVESALGLA